MTKPTARTADRLDSPSMHEVTYETVNITPNLAEKMLAKNLGNRAVRDLRVAVLARDISEGNWRQTGEAIKFDWTGKLIDGQHRLHAIIMAGRATRMLVIRGLDPESQKVIDTGTKRSAGDALRMAGERSAPNVIAAAIRILIGLESGVTSAVGSRLPDVTHSEVLDYFAGREESLASAALAAGRVAKVMGASVSTVAAFAYLTAQIDAEASFRFLSDLENLRTGGKGDPRYTLSLRIRSIRERGERTSQTQQLYYFLRAWNAWREGKSLHGMKDSTQAGAASLPEPK